MTKLRDLPVRYAWLTVALVAAAHIYAQFGRGVRSAIMDNMHLYALLLGFVMFCGLSLAERAAKLDFTGLKLYRLFFNLYNTGLASLLSGRMLAGIVEVAGGSTPYARWFFVCGGAMMAAALCILAASLIFSLARARNA